MWAPGALEPVRELLTPRGTTAMRPLNPDGDAGAEPEGGGRPGQRWGGTNDDGAPDADQHSDDDATHTTPTHPRTTPSPRRGRRAALARSFAHWLTGLGLVGVRAETVQRHLDLTDEIAWSIVLGTELRDALHDLDDVAVAGVRERFLAALADRGATPVDLTTLIAVGQRPA